MDRRLGNLSPETRLLCHFPGAISEHIESAKRGRVDAFQCRLVDGLFFAGAEDVDEAGSRDVSCGFGGVEYAV